MLRYERRQRTRRLQGVERLVREARLLVDAVGVNRRDLVRDTADLLCESRACVDRCHHSTPSVASAPEIELMLSNALLVSISSGNSTSNSSSSASMTLTLACEVMPAE